ncbi:flagellar basal body P-ring formation protein FlgA [Alcaligenaceae bacterium CGII-47]|nr:flagellar basal body P-ring formation protein FlgA [Alcaligenaceae bacterium CGII-47]
MLRSCIALWVVGCAGVAWAAPAPPPQDPVPIITQVESLLHARAQAYPGEAEITVEPPRLSNQTSCSQLEAFLSGNTALRSRMSVGVRCLAPQAWSLYVTANVRLIGHFYVSNRAIPAGQVMSLDDLDMREGDLLRERQAITDPSHIVGYITTRRIPPGAGIHSNALRDPQSILRGQAVRTIARGAGFVASGEGQALGSGAPGTQIQVRSSSGQIITGTVIDAQTVQVMM